LNTELFIARRMLQGNTNKNRLSKPIVFISLASITLGVAIMIITVSVVTGFQEGVRNKVIGFGSHIQVTSMETNNSMESTPILIDQEFYPSIEEEENVRKIQPYAFKPGIIQKIGGTEEAPDIDLQGVLFKGIDRNYDWSFFENKMVDGGLIDFDSENGEVLISEYISQKLSYKVGDTMNVFFIKERPTPRNFVVKGIYSTGFEEFDKQFVFVQINQIQVLNNWGVQTFLTVRDTCIDGKFVLEARSRSGTGTYQYDWGRGFEAKNTILLNGSLEEKIKVISSDFNRNVNGTIIDINSVPDTAWAVVEVDSVCSCTDENVATISRLSATDIEMPFGKILIQNGKGTSFLYTGGFEILIEDWDDLDEMDQIIYENIPGKLNTTKITEIYPGIFSWLDFLDVNIAIIIGLILVVSLMNMVTSLLVLILEKTNMIGILKASGAMDKSIRRIFTYQAMFLLSRGLLFGTILGVSLISIQYFTGVVTLNPEVYYLASVPVKINLFHILLINLLTALTCRIILIIPSLVAGKIRPARAIRFN